MAKDKQEVLEQENKILRQKVETLEKMQETVRVELPHDIQNEIKKIRQKSKPSVNSIIVKEQHDHKNISLWTKDGKRIGPMHPDNAIQTLNRFADFDIVLVADEPRPEQIEAYKQTAEYKAKLKKEQERRMRKNKSLRSGQMEKLAAEIAKMSGTTVEAINHILKAHEVGKHASN